MVEAAAQMMKESESRLLFSLTWLASWCERGARRGDDALVATLSVGAKWDSWLPARQLP